MPAICNRCETDFKQEWRLERHLKRKKLCKSKTDDPNIIYTCNVCQKNFKQKCHLTRHLKTCKNEEEEEEKFKCQYCNKIFKRKWCLGRHRKTCKEKARTVINITT